MHYCKNSRWLDKPLATCCLLLLVLLPLPSAFAEGVYVRSALTEYDGQRYRLSAVIDFLFPSDVLDALHKGVPVGLHMDIEIYRKRSFWMDELVASLVQKVELRYKPLSRKYLVTNLNSGAVHDFENETDAVVFAGKLSHIPLVDKRLLKPDEVYVGRIRAKVSQSHFPFVIRMWSLLRSDWRFESEWYQWPIKE